MGLDLGQGQVGDVAQEGFEAFVLADPLLDLREQVLGDVNGTGFALYLVGQVMGRVALTGLAAAAGPAAFAAEGYEAGGDERAVELKLVNPGLEVAADESGMLGNLHDVGMIAELWCWHI
jgi:hypothetical protein